MASFFVYTLTLQFSSRIFRVLRVLWFDYGTEISWTPAKMVYIRSATDIRQIHKEYELCTSHECVFFLNDKLCISSNNMRLFCSGLH